MRRIILSILTSLDGQVARKNRDLDWFLTDAEWEAEMLALLRSIDGMIFGRVAYQELAQFWPTAGAPEAKAAPGGFASDENRIEFARLMNSVPKLVLSRTLDRLEWGPGRVIRGDVAQELGALKREPGRDIALFAGASAASELIRLDLVDEYQLFVHPIVLGEGLPLFGGGAEARALTLIDSRAFPCGVVRLRYARKR